MFSNAHDALRWAYDTSSKPIVKMSAINHMRRSSFTGVQNLLLVNLTLHDRHGQAALIIGMVERLPYQAEREYIRALFGRKLDQDDLTVLVYQGCQAVGLGLDKKDAIYQIMKGYFHPKKGITRRATRKVLGCRDQYAIMAKRGLYDMLEHIHERAMADISEVLEDHGLIMDSMDTHA